MKKILVGVLMAGIIGTAGTTTLAATVSNNNSTNGNGEVVSVGEAAKVNNLITYANADNNLSSISSAKATEFDAPKASPQGYLERMSSTTIQTKYGNMQVSQDGKGYTVKNLSNSNAPVLYVGVVNMIYTVNTQVDLKGLVTPNIYNSNGQEIKGTITFPNIDTSKPGYGESYIEASDGNGNVTIAPFIYNVVSFKSSINVPTGFNVNNLTVSDILNGGTENLRSYVAHYDEGSGKIIVGVSRGVASARQEVPITFGTQKAEPAPANPPKTTAENQQSTQNVQNNAQGDYKVPLAIEIIISPITYIVIGAILIALIWFLCF
ncbi:MAG: hypothetical protein ACRCYE_12005 [Sarcina sp.]